MNINFEQLRSQIEDASQTYFTLLKVKYSDENICGYSLYLDAEAMSITLALNSKSHLNNMCASDPEDTMYYKWSPGEWAYAFEGGEFFHDISNLLSDEVGKINSQDQFSKFREQVYETYVQSLEKLVNHGFFGKDNVVVFNVSDTDDKENEIKWIKRLNGEKLFSEYYNWARDKAFELGTPGAHPEQPGEGRAVPALRYDNRNPKGNNFVKFDGYEEDKDGNMILIDAKTRIVPFDIKGKPFVSDYVKQSLLNKQRAIKQNPGTKAVIELSDEAAVSEAREVLHRLSIEKDIIKLRVRESSLSYESGIHATPSS